MQLLEVVGVEVGERSPELPGACRLIVQVVDVRVPVSADRRVRGCHHRRTTIGHPSCAATSRRTARRCRGTSGRTRPVRPVLVVGGGIHGLFAAYDAAQRGLSVALVERADFGSGLSFNHQRTLHGGLRALAERQRAEDAASRFANAARGRGSRRTWFGRCPSSSAPTAGRRGRDWRCARASPSYDLHRPAPERRRLAGAAPAEGAARIGGRDATSVSRRPRRAV